MDIPLLSGDHKDKSNLDAGPDPKLLVMAIVSVALVLAIIYVVRTAQQAAYR
jgi:hypothetical protein